jgi:hypothetical protein
MPTPPIDTSRFPTGGPAISYYDPEDLAGLAELEDRARAYVMSFRFSPPIADMILAFGLAPILALFLVRLARPIEGGELAGETEMWAVAADGPSMYFETEAARTPAEALELYCVLAEDWANTVLAGADLAECYPIPVPPTAELANSLLGRVRFIRREFVPVA